MDEDDQDDHGEYAHDQNDDADGSYGDDKDDDEKGLDNGHGSFAKIKYF